ncbi:MAG: hypothetical protein K2Y22_03120 [Candidatus Obscuribacterales bacterium]|nr:hypothetical protein [Candidatus Obscuribacterales bacterium]
MSDDDRFDEDKQDGDEAGYSLPNTFKSANTNSQWHLTPKQLLRIFGVVIFATLFVISLPFLYFGGQIFWEYNRQHIAPIPFDRQTWLKSGSTSSMRQRMINDLTEKYRLEGLSKEQVVELLGPYQKFGNSADWGDMVYPIGSFGMDTMWLSIWLHENKVDKHRIQPD